MPWRQKILLLACFGTQACSWKCHLEYVECILQDTVLVIYSVDILPDAAGSDLSTHHEAQWSCDTVESAGTELESPGSGLWLQSSQCRPQNAWGLESYGMRLAVLQAADMRSIAASLSEPMVDAS
jgi:hypothetical protein